MNDAYDRFIFKNYRYDSAQRLLSLTYGYDERLEFHESYRFDFEPAASYDEELFDTACQTIFFMAGVSYYKMYLATRIDVRSGQLSAADSAFFGQTYQRGLGEFLYRNDLDPAMAIDFPVTDTASAVSASATQSSGRLVAIGGGKDSLVTVELLRQQNDVTLWHMGHQRQLSPLIQRIGLPGIAVQRQIDPTIADHNRRGALNGHIPISAIFAAVGVASAVLSGKRDVVLSNESSASEPNLQYHGVAINHQYSKSLQFERDFQAYLLRRAGDKVRYYSQLRPLTELHIAKRFAPHYGRYADVFSSCNRAFTQDSPGLFWCGQCAKCAFAFLIFTPFIERAKLESLWGKNLLLDPALHETYQQLLGISGDKPLDCVGEIKESRAAMRLAQQQYPELASYQFDLPPGYDWQALSEHAMPPEAFQLLQADL